MKAVRLDSLDEAAGELRRLLNAPFVRTEDDLSAVAAIDHCTESIEYSIVGYPRSKPLFVRNTIGKLVLLRFMVRGYMTHDRKAPVPGAAPRKGSGSTREATERLLALIAAFGANTEPLAPHFVFGDLTWDEYDRVHAMHIADHLCAIEY